MSWKDHPVVIAAISGVAGIAFAVQFLFPSLNAQLHYDHKVELDDLNLQNDVIALDLSKQQAENQQLTFDAEASRRELQSHQTVMAAQKETIAKLEMGRIFDLSNPYPVSFQQIKVLDDINKVESHYEESQINKERSGYWSVKVDHALFEELVYYFNRFSEESEKQSIYQISYRVRDFRFENLQALRSEILSGVIDTGQKTELSDDFLITRLNETLGTGTILEDGLDKNYAWATPYGLTVYITSPPYDSFIVALEGLAPGSWRHPIPRYQR